MCEHLTAIALPTSSLSYIQMDKQLTLIHLRSVQHKTDNVKQNCLVTHLQCSFNSSLNNSNNSTSVKPITTVQDDPGELVPQR